jgi:hypothetical protein
MSIICKYSSRYIDQDIYCQIMHAGKYNGIPGDTVPPSLLKKEVHYLHIRLPYVNSLIQQGFNIWMA